jgi:hypothetical protein
MESERKMTFYNYGRLIITFIFLAGTIFTGIEHKALSIHVVLAGCSLALLARVIYSYMKGRD